MLVLDGDDDGIREDFVALASTDMAKATGVRLRIHRRNEEAPIRPKSHLGEMMRDFTENADKEDSTSFWWSACTFSCMTSLRTKYMNISVLESSTMPARKRITCLRMNGMKKIHRYFNT